MVAVRKYVVAYPHIDIETHRKHPPSPPQKKIEKFIPITLAEKSKCSCYIFIVALCILIYVEFTHKQMYFFILKNTLKFT